MSMLVQVQPLKEEGDARCARTEIDHPSEAGDTGESEVWVTGRTAPW